MVELYQNHFGKEVFISNFAQLTSPAIIDSINYRILQDISTVITNSKNTIFFITGDHPPPLGSELNKHYDNKFIPSIFIKPLKKN